MQHMLQKIFKDLRQELAFVPTVPVKCDFQNNNSLSILGDKSYEFFLTISAGNSIINSRKTQKIKIANSHSQQKKIRRQPFM